MRSPSQKLASFPFLDCFQEKKEGYCYYIANKPRGRYYYDSTDRQCKQFMYNGCGGNTNRFGSREFCESTCQQTFKPKSSKSLLRTNPSRAPPSPRFRTLHVLGRYRPMQRYANHVVLRFENRHMPIVSMVRMRWKSEPISEPRGLRVHLHIQEGK